MDATMDLSLMWKAAWDVFPYFDRVTDWNETYREYLPQAARVQPGRDQALLYARFMARLGDGHTMFGYPMALAEEIGLLPFDLRYTQEGYVIDAAPQGWEDHRNHKVLAINGRPFSEWLKELESYVYHIGDYLAGYGLRRTLPLLLEDRNQMETTAGRMEFSLAKHPVEKQPAPKAGVARPWKRAGTGKLDIRLYEGNILYVHMPDCQYAGAAAEIARAGQSAQIRGVILDLRDNIGGMTRYGGEVAELFISGQFHGCRKWTRRAKGIDIACGSQFAQMESQDGDAMRCIRMMEGLDFEEYQDQYGAPGQEALFHQPCVVLTSRRTVSAAEDTLAFFCSNHRATVLGEPTSGTTGTPYLVPLSYGGARVCSVGYRLLDGTAFIGTGIQPDLLLPVTIEDLHNGFDAQLDRALELLDA